MGPKSGLDAVAMTETSAPSRNPTSVIQHVTSHSTNEATPARLELKVCTKICQANLISIRINQIYKS
jgi:hypothetical protein